MQGRLKQREALLSGNGSVYNSIRNRRARILGAMNFAMSERIGTPNLCQSDLVILLRLRKQLREGDDKTRLWMMRAYGFSIPEIETAAKRLIGRLKATHGVDLRDHDAKQRDRYESNKQEDYKDLKNTRLSKTKKRRRK